MEGISKVDINMLWVLFSATLVFFMQAGFMCLEAGLVRTKNMKSVTMKNLVDWVMASVVFYLVGFGLMFGHSAGGWIGTDLFIPDMVKTIEGGSPLGYVFLLYQAAFAGTAVTIVSGAMSERTGFTTYLIASIFVTLIIYPIFGHWAWGAGFFTDNKAFLANLGFIDFAGSTVVHSIGAWVAIVGIIMVGPRVGRFNAEGKPNNMPGSNIAISGLGVFILWFGWWGFNGGSTLELTPKVGYIILNTILAGSAGGLTAFLHGYYFQKKSAVNEKFLGGILGGLVGITAAANIVTCESALLIGIIAGVIHNICYELLLRFQIDDPVGAFPVHGACGVWGTLAVAIFATPGALSRPWYEQLAVQAFGCAVAAIWASLMAYILFSILRKTVGLRVSYAEEEAGLDISGEVVEQKQELDIDIEELKKLMGG